MKNTVSQVISKEERLPNRWLFVIAAVLMQLGLGNVYSWSIFRNPLMSLHGWSIQEATLPFTLCVVFFAVGMIIAGRWQDRVGPRIVAMTGGVLLGAGFLLASQFGQTLLGLYITYGVLVGLGVGFAYVTPITTCVKWFPDMRGFITGLAVLGFGAGSLIVAPVGTALISQIGVYHTFAIFGVAFGLLVVLTGALAAQSPGGMETRGLDAPGEWPRLQRAEGLSPFRDGENVSVLSLMGRLSLLGGRGPDGDLPSGPDGPGARESQPDGRRGGVGPDVHSQRSWAAGIRVYLR
jgi:MFS family permease